MPPKVKVTREEIINAAVEIVRKNGSAAINARDIATNLKCSTQPIFSNFASMDDLRLAVAQKADLLCEEYIQNEVASGEFPAYKASGMAYIKFAKDEKELFKLLYMRDRSNEVFPKEMILSNQMKSILLDSTGLDEDKMKLFHLEMWIYVHGIATMIATGFLDIDRTLVSKMLTDAYKGMRKQYGLE